MLKEVGGENTTNGIKVRGVISKDSDNGNGVGTPNGVGGENTANGTSNSAIHNFRIL